MPTLRELKNRLQGVKTTGKLAGAMRTVSTAKYSRAAALKRQSAPYSEAASLLYERAAEALGKLKKKKKDGRPKRRRDDGFADEAALPRPVVVLVSGNKGLSGGCDHELFAFFAKALEGYDGPLVITHGRKATEFAKEKRLEVMRDMPAQDVPAYSEAAELADMLTALYEDGSASSIDVCFMHAHNMLKREPVMQRFLPKQAHASGPENAAVKPIFVPDAKTVKKRLLPELRTAELYSWLLDSACAVQSATLVAMRSAYDNASAQAELLETAINRRRQQEVTSSVLETSSGMSV